MDETTSQTTSPQADDAQNAPVLTELEAVQAQCQEYLAGWRRAQADYANLQREREKDRSESMKYANSSLLQSLLPALNQFAIAMRFLPDTSELPESQKKTWENWLVGIRAVQSLWEQAAASVGLERIKVEKETFFDPLYHDAIGHRPDGGNNIVRVLEVVQEGWCLHGRVLQPAKVIVSSVN